ncbi:monooxygenase [Streptomyces syringium]|uniref:FAD binding domain-containing protein n=1 Tax=Streptomyces syringium TaxID=76729 RepID=UPI0033A37245
MHKGRVAVVGGSVAGCAAALAATRAGADEVVVYERAAGRLEDRGVGLAVHDDRYAEMEAAGYIDADIPWVRLTHRPWVVRDGEERAGRTVGAVPFPFRSYNWGSLWQELRARIPASVTYRQGAAVERVLSEPDGATLRFADGSEERFDLVVGADGYRSVVRAATRAATVPVYAGYLAWRGALPAELLPGPDAAWPEEAATSVGFPGGHLMAYRIPGRGGRGVSANWVFYAAPPAGAGLTLEDPTSLPPGAVPQELIAGHTEVIDKYFPPFWQEVIRRTPEAETQVQPIYDLIVPHFGEDRLVLLGDAAAVARPHAGGGAVKALQDASVLEHSLRSAATWGEAVAAYDAARTPSGRAAVELARRLGRAQVQRTPDWPAMDPDGIDAWWRDAADGGRGFGGQAMR